MSSSYLDVFFEEKAIPYASYTFEKGSITHIIDTDAAIDFIKKNDHVIGFTPIIRQLDFVNGDFVEFLYNVCRYIVMEVF